MTARTELLVVAGETSGDEIAAPVVARLGVRATGLGGPRLLAAGLRSVADLSGVSAMGFGAVAVRARQIARAWAGLVREVHAARPEAALLVGYSEFNARFGAWLRRRRVPVLWYGPPQVWAWRPGRARRLAMTCDRMAVLLPFEETLWRTKGADVSYVGHPSLERAAGVRDRPESRAARIALLPGSRGHEVKHHILPMLEAVQRMRQQRPELEATLVQAPSLDARTCQEVSRAATAANVTVTRTDAASALRGHHVALAASGTVTLDCIAAGVPPVIVYRTDPITWELASRLSRVPYAGLPNILLGEAAFPELLQNRLTGTRLALEAAEILAHRRGYREQCRRVAGLLSGPTARAPSESVSAMIAPWLRRAA